MKEEFEQHFSSNGKFKNNPQRVRGKALGDLQETASFTDNSPSFDEATSKAQQAWSLATESAQTAWLTAKKYKYQALAVVAVAGIAGIGYMMMTRNKMKMPSLPRFRSSVAEQKPAKKRGKKLSTKH